MTFTRFIVAGLRHHLQAHLAVALVAAVATAILTGALVIGDSVRLSLRGLALERLGHIDRMLVAQQPFRDSLADELERQQGFADHFTDAQSLLIVTAAVEYRDGKTVRRATDVQIVGYAPKFWSLASGKSQTSADGVIATKAVVSELQIEAGDRATLSLPIFSALPADSALGDKFETSLAEPVAIDEVIAGEGFARFGLFATQSDPRTIFIPLTKLQQMMQLEGEANTLVVASVDPTKPTGDAATDWLAENFRPQLGDYGLVATQPSVGEIEHWQIASRQLVLPEDQVNAIRDAMPEVVWQPISTYLANTIARAETEGKPPASVSYSLIAGVDSTDANGPLRDTDGRAIVLTDDEIALNDWLAERLGVKLGDEISFTYYEPESTHGQLAEQRSPTLRVAAIVPLADENGQPTLAADPSLTPELEGVTDSDTINDWDVPFELTEPISDEDEAYWDKYRTTPKAFIAHSLAAKLFASRWGSTSLLRRESDDSERVEGATLAQQLEPRSMGLPLLPVKAKALASATGTTPFDGLFFGFSMFLIASAVMLLAIVVGLAIAQRFSEVGILLSIGWTRRRTNRLLGTELLVVGIFGSVVGVAAGVAYAGLMVWLLTTVWVDAIATPFIELRPTPRSLVIGLFLGVLTTWLVSRYVLRRVMKRPAYSLVSGRSEEFDRSHKTKLVRRWSWLSIASLVAALAASGAGLFTRGEAQAGAFFACGAALLVLMLSLLHRWLAEQAQRRTERGLWSLTALSFANLYRKPAGSTLLVGLVAAASFLLLAIGAFRLSPSEDGVGGYDWIATSDQPLLFDLGAEDGRLELGMTNKEEQRLAECSVVSFRVSDGEEASCLHLFKPDQPRVLGVDPRQLASSKFEWVATLGLEGIASPWNVLSGPPPIEEDYPIPCILDANTAMYSLQLYGGVGSTFTLRDGDNNEVTMIVAGLLKNSVLQGEVIVGDEAFDRLFPDVAGHRKFLISDANPEDGPPIDGLLENRLGDVGFDMVDTRGRLAQFLAVQNTYLSTFQSLGGLGLLLGTLGLAAVELRSLLARRGELALMRACGFTPRRLLQLVLLENLWLLIGGLLVGAIAAAGALIPPATVQQTQLPVGTTAALLGAVILAGVASSWLATRKIVRAAIVPSLRGD